MKHYYIFLISFSLLITTQAVLSQVGIGTTTPSVASALDISATSDGGATYKGFLPPRIPNAIARNTIVPNNTSDIGMLIFYETTQCFQLWNGSAWEDIHCLNTISFTGFSQNFDLSTSWGYVSDIPFFDNGVLGFYGITDASNSIFSNLTTLTNNFLGIRDLNDTEDGNGTAGIATVTFNTIDVSSAGAGTTIAFEYETYRMDNGDDAFYTVIIDGIAQPTVQFINGTSDSSTADTITISIPGGTSTTALLLQFQQNGDADVFGFDNFRIF